MKYIGANVTDIGETYGKEIVKEVIEPFMREVIVNLEQIEKKEKPELIDFEYLRFGMKIFLELFCAMSANSELRVIKPFNHIIFYYYYFKDEESPSFLSILARILNILIKSDVPMISQLRDSLENRETMLCRIIFKMIRNRIKTFINNAF